MIDGSARRKALAVLVAVNILNFYDRYVVGALTEPIRKEFHLNDAEIGLITSAFIWLYAIVGLPLGRAADVRSRKALLTAGMFVWAALTGVGALAVNYTMLLFSRLGFAVGEAVVAPAATSWIGDLYPAAERSRPLSLFMLGVPVGGALSYFLSATVAQTYGWRSAMILAAFPVLVVAPLLLRLREPVRGSADSGKCSAVSPWSILRIPTMWWIIASGALINFILYALSIFLPALLSRIHGLSLAQSGLATGAIFGVGGVCGGLIGGRIGDRMAKRRLLAASVTCILAAPFAWMAIGASGVAGAIVWMAVAYGALNSYYGLVYSAIQDLVGAAARGMAMAVYFMAMYMCGASFGPLLTGRLSDLMARRAATMAGSVEITEAFKAIGLQQAMYVVPVLAVLLAVVLYAGSRTMVRDA